jgi:hypothetical protein
MPRPQKITFGEMRAANVRGLLIYWNAISGDRWPDDVRLSDLEMRFVCQEAPTYRISIGKGGRA